MDGIPLAGWVGLVSGGLPLLVALGAGLKFLITRHDQLKREQRELREPEPALGIIPETETQLERERAARIVELQAEAVQAEADLRRVTHERDTAFMLLAGHGYTVAQIRAAAAEQDVPSAP